MNLREQVLKEHSRINSLYITEWIGNSVQRFDELMQLFMGAEYRVVQRSAWVISLVAEKYPQLIQPHLPVMVQRISETNLPVAVKRNVIRVLEFIDLPESLQGPVMNTCFNLLADPTEPIAVRCNSMTVLGKLAKSYPEIKPEIQLLINEQLQHPSSPGFKSRAANVLKNL